MLQIINSIYLLFCPAFTNFRLLFLRFSKMHAFEKPNDVSALRLMNACATSMLEKFPDIVFAYGVSDEYRYNTFLWKLNYKIVCIYVVKKLYVNTVVATLFWNHGPIISASYISSCLQFCFQRGHRILSKAGKVSVHFFN